MPPTEADRFTPGQRVIVTQQIPQRDEVWSTRVTGQVVRYEQAKTGSWYAHSKDHKLWLDRLVVRKDDGEIVVCNLDSYTHVDLVSDPAAPTPDGSRQSKEGTSGSAAAPAAE